MVSVCFVTPYNIKRPVNKTPLHCLAHKLAYSQKVHHVTKSLGIKKGRVEDCDCFVMLNINMDVRSRALIRSGYAYIKVPLLLCQDCFGRVRITIYVRPLAVYPQPGNFLSVL